MNSYINGIGEVISISGPIIGVLLIDQYGIKGALLVNSISFFLSAIIEILLKKKTSLKQTELNKREDKIFEEFVNGWKYIRTNKRIFKILMLASGVNLCLAGYILLLPFLPKINVNLGNEFYGVALSIQAVGGIVGAILCNMLKLRLSEKYIGLFLGGVGLSVLLISLFIDINKILIFICIFCYGVFISMFNIQFITYIQQNTASQYLGRVFSFVFTFAILFMPLGNVIFTFLFEYIKIYSFLVMGILVIILSLIYVYSYKNEKSFS